MSDRESWLGRLASVRSTGRIPIIAEIKPSSPVHGELVGDRDISEITKAYVEGGAACISVVTGRWFGGNIAMLEMVALSTGLPLLRKDLITNLDQVSASSDSGANAILLTRKILELRHLEKMIDMALSKNMTPFIEVADAGEVAGIPACEDMIIAITNRDIARKETDTDSGLKSLDLIDQRFRVGGALVSASGIQTPAEASSLYAAGFDGLLIGTSLLTCDDPRAMLRQFTNAME